MNFTVKLTKGKKQIEQKVEVTLTQGKDLTSALDNYVKGDNHQLVGKFGVNKLDKILYGGIETGKIYSIVAPSGGGKTALAVQVFHNSLKRNIPCMYISTEMSKEVLIARLLTRETGIPENLILSDRLTVAQQEKLSPVRLSLDDMLDKTQSVIVDKVSRVEVVIKLLENAREWFGTPLVILDHLHNLRSDDDIFTRVSNAAHQIQEVAVKHNIAFLLLAQMSKADLKARSSEGVSAKGAMDVNEVSDVFIAMNNRTKDDDTRGVALINKHRWGGAGKVDLQFKYPNKLITEATEIQDNFEDELPL